MKKFKLLVSLTLVLTLIMSVIVVAPVNAGAAQTAKLSASEESFDKTFEVGSAEELNSAQTEINSSTGKNYLIKLTNDIDNGALSVKTENTVTIYGENHTISTVGSIVVVEKGGVINIGAENYDKTLTLDGKNVEQSTEPGLICSLDGGTCNMYQGVTVKDRYGENYLGGGVTVQSGTFNMYGGTIDNCRIDGGSVCYGGGVAVFGKGKFVMNGGTISNCYALSDYVHDPSQNYKGADNLGQLGYIFKTAMGGGVFVTGESTFIMNDGTITGNKSTRRGGGVCVSASLSEGIGYVKSKVVINGGTISSNESNVGGGIYVSGQELPYSSAIVFNAIVSGTVEVENITGAGNKTSARAKKELLLTGDGDNPAAGFNMNGGTVTDNTANVAGGGVEIHAVKEAATLKNADVENNTANYTSGLIKDTNDVDGYFHFKENGCGGGILVGYYNSNVTVENCTVSNNSSEKNGGGVALVDAKTYPTTIKDSTIKDNESNARGAGVYYDANSKLNMCGADIVQDNMYDNHLNNVNVLSTANPIYVTDSLEGSKIGLSDPRLWDDNMTDAEAPDDGSAELLTNGYKANNPDVHPSEYFTSDHDTWIVDRTSKTEKTTVVNSLKKYSANTQTLKSTTASSNYIPLGFYTYPYYVIVNAESFNTGKADSVEKIYTELKTRYAKEYTTVSLGEDVSTFSTVEGITVTVTKNTNDVTVVSNKLRYPTSPNPRNISTTIKVTPGDQQNYANDGQIALKVTNGSETSTGHLPSKNSAVAFEELLFTTPNTSRTYYKYDDIGRIVATFKITSTTPVETVDVTGTTVTGNDNEVKLIRRKTPLKFHDNKDKVGKGDDKLFRVYNAENPAEFAEITEDGAAHSFNNKGGVEEFYNIPKFAEDDYVFAGWYTVADNDDNDKSKAFEFNTAVPSDVEDVYAHWIPVGEVSKDADDDKELPSSMNGKYKGFEMFGVQIRPEANFDSNYGDVMPGGLRFIASISEDLLENIKDVHEDNKIEYGFVSAAESTVNTVVNSAEMGIDSAKYTLQYKGKNVNGVDTLLDNATKEGRKCPNNFRYITNVDCTSKVGGYGTKVKEDHRNFTNYRLATYVVTYNDDESGANKGKNVAARAYLRYTDANGLLRTFYNDYNGTNFYGGCSTSYNYVKDMATNTKAVK